jgi:hypothetical protein
VILDVCVGGDWRGELADVIASSVFCSLVGGRGVVVAAGV